MASILGDRGDDNLDFGQGSSSSTVMTSSTVSTPPTPPPAVQYGWVIPVIVGAVCLVVIALCVTWFALYNKRRAKRYRLQNINTHQREQSFDEWARTSLRSAEKSRREREIAREREREPVKKVTTCHSMCRPPDYRPRLGMIRESPEDRLADLKSKGHVIQTEEKLFSPEDSVFAKNQESVLSVVSGQIPYYASPGYYPSSAHSHPNLITAQAPFSPYRLTWISPSTTMDPRVIRSDPNIGNMVESSYLPCQPHSVSSSLCGTSYYQSNPCVKSPYNPNHNTPASSDGDSGKGGVPANAVINQSWVNNSLRQVDSNSSSAQASPQKRCDEKKCGSPMKSMRGLASRGQQTGNDLPCCDSRCEMMMMSYVAPPCALDRSHLPHPVYTRVMQQDHPVRTSGCEQCQACIISDHSSLNPDIGSSSTSVYNNNYIQCNNSGPYPCSNNTSVCGHMDSMELTHFSNITGQHSYNASGYHAGPSHSTSIAGHMSSHMTSRDGSVSSRDESKSSGPVSKESAPGDSAHSVLPHDTTASDLTSGDTSHTTTNSSQRLSTTIHSTRSAPAAIGNHNNSTWADSNTDSVNMDGTGPEQPHHQHVFRRPSIPPIALAPIQLPSLVEASIVSQSLASASLASSRYTPESLCHNHMAVDVPQDVVTPDAEWDTFPFYTPLSVVSNGTSHHTTPDSLAEYGPHLHLMYTAQPVLRDAQYWV